MAAQKRTVDGFELNFSSDWIKHLEGQEHWAFYWHQAKLVEDHIPQDSRVLEIGVGTKFLSNYLRSRGREIITLDIDADKAPDYVDDASSFDYGALDVESVLAFEIFEHLPFPLFCRVIERLSACEVKRIVFSVPWCEKKLLRAQVKLPRMKPYRFAITLPWRRVSTINHFWELDPFSAFQKKRTVDQTSNEKVLIPLSQLTSFFESQGYTISAEKKVDYIQFFTAVRSA